ncbi:MAG: helix-turn-helix transcriptional regulator [bacterium]|nr:helix-turn-helix transcriptional regulator [bacterium]
MKRKFKHSRFSIDKVSTGKRLRSFRKSQHLTITELSKQVGISIGMISETEAGKNKPSPTLMYAMHRLYNMNLNWLLTGEGDRVIKRTATVPAKDEKGSTVIDTDTLMWYMERIPWVMHTVLGFFSKFYLENQDFLDTLAKKRERAVQLSTPEPSEEEGIPGK